MKHKYIIYDARARYNVSAAAVLDTCDSIKQARSAKRMLPDDSVTFKYDMLDAGGTKLVNGRIVE